MKLTKAAVLAAADAAERWPKGRGCLYLFDNDDQTNLLEGLYVDQVKAVEHG